MSYWQMIWIQFKRRRIGFAALTVLIIFFLVGLYAPLFASNKPLLVIWNGKPYFPLLRYLFYPGLYTKPIDLFYNVLMLTLPLTLLGAWLIKRRGRKLFFLMMIALQFTLFGLATAGKIKDPAGDPALKQARRDKINEKMTFREDPLLAPFPHRVSWVFDLQYMTPYEKLNKVLRYNQWKKQHENLSSHLTHYEAKTGKPAPTLWAVNHRNEEAKKRQYRKIMEDTREGYKQGLDRLPVLIEAYRPYSHDYLIAKYSFEHAPEEIKEEAEQLFEHALQQAAPSRTPLAKARKLIEAHQKASVSLAYLEAREQWLEKESRNLKVIIPPLVRNFHWEEDAGGSQALNSHLPWWELTRTNRKDLLASLLFGVRISLVVGLTAILISLGIGIPLGMVAGYFANKTDLVISRVVEVWEAMPTFFMLLLVVAITQSKSIFLVIGVLGIFGWTGFARFIRAEVLKQRGLPYVTACTSIGYRHGKVMFSHILPNAIPPILTLLPFAMMAAITAEAGISFLGLGEEGSTSWGVLMDEGRSVFPAESYLLWPPAILLTILLVSIALVGDALRDAIDPRMRD